MRSASIERNTAETQIKLTLNLDGSGKSDIDSGVGFLDHMLTLFMAGAGSMLWSAWRRIRPRYAGG